MLKVLLVGLGGFIGSISRYLVGGLVHKVFSSTGFPYGTLVVNVFGCLLIGFVVGLVEFKQLFRPEIRLFLLIGVLGGFTTFSTFSYETFALTRDGETLRAGMNVLLHIVVCFGAVWIGNILSRTI
jgi:CrcB protein